MNPAPRDSVAVAVEIQRRDFLFERLASRENEVFALILLNAQHRLIEYVELFTGTVHAVTAPTREVVRMAMHHNASAVIIAHNHPSGDPEPSLSDIGLTRRLRAALALVEVQLLDHFIVGQTVTSFVMRGLSLS